jgi:O-antigen ligase
MLVAMTLLGSVKWYKVAITCLIGALLVVAAEPDYVVRLSSLDHVGGLFSKQESAPDFSIMRRYAENVACIEAFMTSPIIGVGPGHFVAFYSEPYVNQTGIVRQVKGYRGHSLYFETAAETGLLGILTFLSIVGSMMLRLRREYRSSALRDHPEYVDLMKAFFVSIVGYMISAIFLHLSYPRYFWLLLALANASVAVVRSQAGEDTPLDNDHQPNFSPAADVPSL